MLKTYQTCPKKFYWQYIENIHIPKYTTPFEKGKKIHALANYYLQGTNITRLQNALSSEEKIIWDSLLNNPFYNKKYYNSEYSISCKIDTYWIGGRIDAVVYEENDYYILDYKTGKTPNNPEYDYQTMVYLLCMDKILKEYNSLSFVYISLKEKKNYVIKYTPQLKKEYESKIIEICSQIDLSSIYKSNLENCKNCEYKDFCS